MLFHKKNVGLEVTINGKTETISQITADKKAFRVKSEEKGPVVNDYDVRHIEAAKSLIISVNDGKSWFSSQFIKDV